MRCGASRTSSGASRVARGQVDGISHISETRQPRPVPPTYAAPGGCRHSIASWPAALTFRGIANSSGRIGLGDGR